MKIHYDAEVDALDIIFKKGRVTKTKELGPGVLLDVDKRDEPLSREILDAKKRYSPLNVKSISIKELAKAGK